jgi:TorA maturation chaperone TorD
MQTAIIEKEPPVADMARECLYRFLAAVVAGPYAGSWRYIEESDDQLLAVVAAGLIQSEAENQLGPLGFGERMADDFDLAALVAELHAPVEELRDDYNRVFGLVIPKECPPYETEYLPSSEPFFRSQELADIAGFFRAFGVEPASAFPERPDYLAIELEFLAFLLMKKRLALGSAEWNPDAQEQAEVCAEAERDFVRDHFAWWVPAFATGLARKAGRGYLYELGRVLAALVPLERERLGIPVPEKPGAPSFIERPEEQPPCATCPLLG